MTESLKPRFDRTFGVFLLAALALIVTAGVCGLFEPTETRYAEIAREMRASGDWLVPRLNGIAHFEKPPFAYWAAAAGMRVFGENNWGARIPVALASLLTLVFAWVAARRRFAGVAAQPALVIGTLATMALPFALGRTLATDPFLATAVAGFWALAPSPVAIALLGLGFFIKGPVVFVFTLAPLLVAAAWGRNRGPLRLLAPGWSWALFAGIALPWFIVVSLRVPKLLGFFLGSELWQRYATHAHHREGAPWYFIAVIVGGALPWTGAVIAGIASAWRNRSQDAPRLLLAWVIVPVAFFSLSGSKLPAYVLPCFPAIAMLAASGLQHAGRALRWTTAATLLALAACGLVAGPALLARAVGAPPGVAAALPALATAGLASWALGALFVGRGGAAAATLLVLAGWLALAFGLAHYESPLGSPRAFAELLQQHRGPGEPVVELRKFNAGLPFTLGETVRLLEVERDTRFTTSAERARVMITRDSLVALAQRSDRVWLLAPGLEGAALSHSLGLDYQRVATWRGSTLGFATCLPLPVAPAARAGL